MPNEKKNYLGLLISIAGTIGSLLVFLSFYFFHNNSSSLEKQEEIVNLQEENKIADEEIINNPIILDNTIINLIIFLLFFIFAFFFVFSLIFKKNNGEYKKNNKSFFRKAAFFKGETSFKRIDYFYEYDNRFNYQGGQRIKLKLVKKENNIEEYEFENCPENCNVAEKNAIEEKEINFTPEKIEEIKRESIHEGKKRQKIFSRFLRIKEKTKFFFNDRTNIDIKGLPFDAKIPSNYQEYFMHFEGKVDFFNCYNIFAFLLSYGFFFAFFAIPYFVFYFFYALIYAFLEEIKENKFFFALYKALHVLIFFNFRNLSKIIPIICFLGVLIFNGFLFFAASCIVNNFFPIIYDTSDPNAKLIERIMNINQCIDFERIFAIGKVDIQIDKDGPYLSFDD